MIILCVVASILAAIVPSAAWAEPMFLAKHTRCTNCHFADRRGLLTPHGRLLSHHELSTTGGARARRAAGAEDDCAANRPFLYGVLGDALGPVHLGLEMRPSRLHVGFPGGSQDMNLLMNLDLVGAVQKGGWTAYGAVGREPPNSAVRDGRTLPDAAFISYEHWISYQTEKGFRIRGGRFLPAYGVRFADHTTYSRIDLDLDRNDQVYGLEVSDTIGPTLVQVMVSPGKAEAILHDHDHRSFSTAGRWQFDLTPRTAIVGSVFYRHSTDLDPKSGSAGGAFGFAPSSRVTIWTELDADLQTKAAGGTSWVVVNETSVEAYRGVAENLAAVPVVGWRRRRLRLAPSGTFGGSPRTHWNVNLSYYRDRSFDATTTMLLAQLHCTYKHSFLTDLGRRLVAQHLPRTPEGGRQHGTALSSNRESLWSTRNRT